MDVLDFNFTDYLKYALALVFVLSLIAIVAVIARRAGFGLSTSVHGKRQRRLGIVESMNIDGKRKLVLLKRDNTEHLILLGAEQDLLIESAIAPQQNALTQALQEAAQATRTDGPSDDRNEPRFEIPTPPKESDQPMDLPSGLKGPTSGNGPGQRS